MVTPLAQQTLELAGPCNRLMAQTEGFEDTAPRFPETIRYFCVYVSVYADIAK